MRIGEKIDILLKWKKMPKSTLAKTLNCSKGLVTQWVQNQRTPRKYLKELSEIFNVPIKRLTDDHDDLFDLFIEHETIVRNLEVGNDLQTAEVFNSMGVIYRRVGKNKEALFYYRKSMEIIKKNLNKNHILYAQALNNIALILDNIDIKISYYKEVLEIYNNNRLDKYHPYRALVLNNIGLAYYEDNRFDEAVLYYDEALKIREARQEYNHPKTAQIYNNIGLVYLKIKDYNNAMQYFMKAMNVWDKFGDIADLGTLYLNLGVVFYKIGRYNEAIENYSKSLSINLGFKNKNELMISTIYNNLGDAYNKNKEYNKAIECHNKSKELVEKLYGKEHEYYQDSVKKIKSILVKT